MKKAILFLLGLIVLSAVTNAQSFKEGSRIVNAGIGMWSGYYRGYYSPGIVYRNSPTVVLSFEQGLSRKGPGCLSAGALLTWQTSVYKNYGYYFSGDKYYYSNRYTNYVLAGRVAYHWDELVGDDFDVYGGVTGGLRFQTYKYNTDYQGTDLPYYYNTSRLAVHPVIALYAGARWYFSGKAAVYGEISGGAGIPYVNLGLSFAL